MNEKEEGKKYVCYKLRPEIENSQKQDSRIDGALALNPKQPSTICRKCYLSFSTRSQKRSRGKQMTIKGGLKEGVPQRGLIHEIYPLEFERGRKCP